MPIQNLAKVKPVISYLNCDTEKAHILNDNKGKSVIYRWFNQINKNTYVGSTSNLTIRMYKYFSVKHLLKSNIPINNALLKYGYSNFSLEILEYCSEKDLLIREQHYIDLYKPEYNILKIAGSSLGFKHSKNTLEFFRNDRKVSEKTRHNLSLAAAGRVLSEEDKNKISESRKGLNLSKETREKISLATTTLIGISVKVLNTETKQENVYSNLTESAKAIGVSRTAISKALLSEKPIKKFFIVSKV